MRAWSQSQQKFIDTPDTVSGGVSSQVPSGMATGAQSTGGVDLRQLYSLLFQASPETALKEGSKFSTAIDIMQPKATATETAKKQEQEGLDKLNKQLDTVYNTWKKIPITERIPFPFRKKVAENAAEYENKKKLLTYQVITTLADRRITNEERQYFESLFPTLLDTDAVAKRKMKAVKEFIEGYSSTSPPATIETSDGQSVSISDLWGE